jgi:isocitrate/isopropylmalate dehydrogenase
VDAESLRASAKPVHGSAPDIAGQGITNPVGKVWSGQMMLEWLGEKEATQALMGAIEKVLQEGTNAQLKGESDLLTPDMGGKGTTEALGRAIEEEALEIKFEEGVGKKSNQVKFRTIRSRSESPGENDRNFASYAHSQ